MARKQRMKVRDKKVQKMTRNGLIEENLTEKSTARISKRDGDVKLERKSHLGADERMGSSRTTQQSRDAPIRGRRNKDKRLRTSDSDVGARDAEELFDAENQIDIDRNEVQTDVEDGLKPGQSKSITEKGSQAQRKYAGKYREGQKTAGEGKLQEKERKLSTSRGDSRKADTGGTKRPQQKRRLQFASEETGAADSEKAAVRTDSESGMSEVDIKRAEKKQALKEHSDKRKVYQQQEAVTGKKTRLNFASDETPIREETVLQTKASIDSKAAIRNEASAGAGRKIASVAAGTAIAAAHRKMAEYGEDNAAVEGIHDLELGAEGTGRLAATSVRARNRGRTRKAVRLEKRRDKEAVKAIYQEKLTKDEKLRSSSLLKKQIQKARIKREYAKAKHAEATFAPAPKGTIDYIKKIGGKVTDFFKENRKVYISVGVLIAMMFIISASLTSCSAMFMQNLVDYSGVSYMSSDEALRDADLYYSQLEANLQERINNMETTASGYDRYQYQINEIGHDPFILASYLSAKYEIFEFDDTIKAELDELFAEQYSVSTSSSTETITETRTVRVGESLGQVVTSGYCSCPICCGQWSGGPTASGVYPTANHTIAVDASNPTLPMGTKVVMNGVEYTVEDTGGLAQYGVDFDVYYDDHSTALAHGHQTWEAYLADDNGSQEVEVTTTSEQSVYSVTVTNRSLQSICQSRLGIFDRELFSAYNDNKGNLQMLESPFEFNWYYRISSYYGYRIHPISGANALHNGLDISAEEGTSVAAGMDGKVTTAAYNGSYGNYVVIKNSDGYEIRYAHLSSISVSAGQSIEKGTEIGKVGSTGSSTGPHLHLELLHNGERINPIFYFETGTVMPNGNVEYSSEAARRLVEYSLQFQGTPYVWGGYSPSGFDCSGFVSYCLTNSGVLNTGRLDTNGLLSMMTVIPESELQPGDIVFFQGTYATAGASHVGIYIGNGEMVHSGNPNKITSIYSPYFQEHWMCAARW